MAAVASGGRRQQWCGVGLAMMDGLGRRRYQHIQNSQPEGRQWWRRGLFRLQEEEGGRRCLMAWMACLLLPMPSLFFLSCFFMPLLSSLTFKHLRHAPAAFTVSGRGEENLATVKRAEEYEPFLSHTFSQVASWRYLLGRHLNMRNEYGSRPLSAFSCSLWRRRCWRNMSLCCGFVGPPHTTLPARQLLPQAASVPYDQQ